MDQGRRDVDELEIVFYELRSLPAEARAAIVEGLRKTL